MRYATATAFAFTVALIGLLAFGIAHAASTDAPLSPVEIVDLRGETGATRPVVSDPFVVIHSDPDFRVVASGSLYGGRADLDGNGSPDRVEQATEAASATLATFASLGLGGPADDGDGEPDVLLLPLGGGIGAYVYLEETGPRSRGATGYVVVDSSPGRDADAFRRLVSAAVARLILAGIDADAPAWWADPSARWLASRAVGSSPAIRSPFDRPERLAAGPMVTGAVATAGNVRLLDALQDDEVAATVMSESWSALGSRTTTEAIDALDAAFVRTIGLDLARLFARAVTLEIVTTGAPLAGAFVVDTLPAFEASFGRPIAPGGLALVEVLPGTEELTVLTPRHAADGWIPLLLVQRTSGEWELARIGVSGEAGGDAVLLPWADYARAVLVYSRASDAPGPGVPSFDLTRGDAGQLFALSSSGASLAQRSSTVEISWSSAWESELFGWLVERAESPTGPWNVVHPFPTPALGTADEGAGYSVEAPWSVGDGRLYFRVVALTQLGLRVASEPFVVVSPTSSR